MIGPIRSVLGKPYPTLSRNLNLSKTLIPTLTRTASPARHRSTDYGVTWTALTATSSQNWNTVVLSSNGSMGLAGVQDGNLYISQDFSQTWTKINGTSAEWYDLACSTNCK